ncbi:S26 family signal peptidase [Hyphomonas sp. KY3]|jgi:conjugative transfer signal peptidase TraF|uniref:S26 family signal peptidase n=1 Tax=Hyphomonas sp. KY3 TaxID=2016196 RepID=UPI001A8D290A|nr:S26 family signal peptidase [Hyphomonas sp. KY3]QSR22007.1 S26 family signal peptidase [Hyphomonas sp. KY3]GJL86610.1 MAG: chromosome segregation protein ParM [Minwuia thermotolerans]
MKKLSFWLTLSGISLVTFGSIFDPLDRLIWNRTASAPTGIYWLSDEPFIHGRWVVVSSQSAVVEWAETRGYVGKDWPFLKQIAGMPGDEICRNGHEIRINSEPVAIAKIVDSSGRMLPVWEGCSVLQSDEVFVLTAHPASLDGRYFGPIKQSDLDGTAIPLMTSQD